MLPAEGDAGRNRLRVWLSRRRTAAVRGDRSRLQLTLAFRALPLVLVMSALCRRCCSTGGCFRVVRGFSWVLERTLGVGGAVGVSAAANVFVGWSKRRCSFALISAMSRGELFMVMTVRHGHDRGHGDGAVRELPRARGPRRAPATPHRVPHQHPRRIRGGGAYGPAARAPPPAARWSHRPTPRAPWTPLPEARCRGWSYCSTSW